jgi:hypothetical protein
MSLHHLYEKKEHILNGNYSLCCESRNFMDTSARPISDLSRVRIMAQGTKEQTQDNMWHHLSDQCGTVYIVVYPNTAQWICIVLKNHKHWGKKEATEDIGLIETNLWSLSTRCSQYDTKAAYRSIENRLSTEDGITQSRTSRKGERNAIICWESVS